MSRNDPIEIACEVVRETDKAIQIDHGGEELVWIPKSQITDYGTDGIRDSEAVTSVFIPEWLAQDKGLI